MQVSIDCGNAEASDLEAHSFLEKAPFEFSQMDITCVRAAQLHAGGGGGDRLALET